GQLVRFDALPLEAVAEEIERLGAQRETALACARLSLGDGERARELASAEGAALRAAAEEFATAVLKGRASTSRPWSELLSAVRRRGEATREALEAKAIS